MDINSLKNIDNLKSLISGTVKDVQKEVSKIKDIDKKSIVDKFNSCVSVYLKQNYFNFNGRVSRYQYWMFFLYTFVAFFVLHLIGLLLPFTSGLVSLIKAILVLVLIVPSIGLIVRRLHDINFSGTWGFLAIFCVLPLIGVLAVLVLLFLLSIPGDKKTNKYGAVNK